MKASQKKITVIFLQYQKGPKDQKKKPPKGAMRGFNWVYAFA
jgi:hypothetical protein